MAGGEGASECKKDLNHQGHQGTGEHSRAQRLVDHPAERFAPKALRRALGVLGGSTPFFFASFASLRLGVNPFLLLSEADGLCHD